MMATPLDPSTLLERVVLIARSNLGYGEVGGNNRGKFIRLIGGDELSVDDPAWCALFAGYCYRRAYEILRPYDKQPAWLFRRYPTPEAGARNLVTQLATVGRSFEDPDLCTPGDLVLWKRKGGHHVAVVEWVEDGLVHTIEGNVGRYPAKVKRLVHDVVNEDAFVTFASIKH
jgi:hypothetical protein